MQVIKFGEFLNPRMYTQIHTSTVVQGRGFLVPRRLSLGENVRAKEGGKKTNCETSLRMPFFTLPMVPCGSLPIARNYLAKNEAPEEEADGGGGGSWWWMEPLPEVSVMLQYFETILPLVESL